MSEIVFKVVGFTGMADNSPANILNFVDDTWNPNGEYKITNNNNYTHLIAFNKINVDRVKIPKKNIFGFQQEPPWSRMFDKNLTNKCGTVFTHCPNYYNNPKNTVKSTTICMHNLAPKNKASRLERDKTWSINKIVDTDFEKKNKLSIAFSYYDVEKMGRGPGSLISRCGVDCYKHRNDLILKLFKSDIEFSLWGDRWDKALSKWGIRNDSRYKGFAKNKIDCIKDFEYHISVENDLLEGQISEKLTDPIMCKTIPIYYGAPDVSKYFNMDGIEIIDGYSYNCIDEIKKIISKPYESYDKDVLNDNIKSYREINFNPFKKVIDYINETK